MATTNACGTCAVRRRRSEGVSARGGAARSAAGAEPAAAEPAAEPATEAPGAGRPADAHPLGLVRAVRALGTLDHDGVADLHVGERAGVGLRELRPGAR